MALTASPHAAQALPPANPFDPSPSQPAYVANGPVNAIAAAGGRTYLGGDFTRMGRRSGSGAVLSASGVPGGFPEVAGGDVHAVVKDGRGGWYIGGDFTAVGGQPRIGLAHVLAGGVVDPDFAPAVTESDGDPAAVYALALSTAAPDAGTLYVGGEFSRIGENGGLTRSNLAALRPSPGADPVPTSTPDANFSPATSCQPLGSCSPAVLALALTHVPLPVAGGADPTPPQPIVLVGGAFTHVGPSDARKPVDGLAAFWGREARDSSGLVRLTGEIIMSGGISPAPWGQPETLAIAGSTTSPRVRAIQAPAGPITSPGHANPALPVYVGGMAHQQSSDVTPRPIARAFPLEFANASQRTITPSRGSAYTWAPNPGGCSRCEVRALALVGDRVYLGGDFTTIGPAPGARAMHLAAIDAISNPSTAAPAPPLIPLHSGVDGPVHSLVALIDGGSTTLFAGGDFERTVVNATGVSGSAGRGIRAFSPSGAPLDSGTAPAWADPSPDAGVRALAAANGAVYAGGRFRALGSVERRGLAALDSAGELLAWAPAVGATDGSPHVQSLAARDDRVYVGGRFDSVSGQPRANLAAIDSASGGVVAGFDTAVERTEGTPGVSALALLGSTLYVGGAFDRVDGQPRGNLAALDADTGDPSPSWQPSATGGVVHDVLPACGAVYVAGGFAKVNGEDRRYLAAVDPASGATSVWDAAADGVVGGAVVSLARAGSTLYAAGNFASIGGALRYRVAGLDVSTGRATAFAAGEVDQPVHAVASDGTTVYIGGDFSRVGGVARGRLAALDSAGGLTGWAPEAHDRVSALVLADDRVHVGGRFTSLGGSAASGIGSFGPGAGVLPGSSPCTSPVVSGGGSESRPNSAESDPTSQPATTPRPSARRAGPVEALAVGPRPVRLGGAPLTVRVRLARAYTLRLTFERRTRVRCRRRGSWCVRYARVAVVTRRAKRGLNRFSFRGARVGGRRLRPGHYRLRVTVPGGRGRSVAFRVVRR